MNIWVYVNNSIAKTDTLKKIPSSIKWLLVARILFSYVISKNGIGFAEQASPYLKEVFNYFWHLIVANIYKLKRITVIQIKPALQN